MPRSHRAFTLFEVAIALGIVAIGVTTAVIVFPSGLRAQHQARFRLYAAAKAVEMIESFATCDTANLNIDSEAMAPWDVPVGYRALAPDLEAKLCGHAFGLAPLPLAIARRLDSEGGEIQRLLDEGAYVYYSQPMAALTNVDVRWLQRGGPTEAQRLILGVVGYAQANAPYALPWKAWPYYLPYPSPPAHGVHRAEFLPPDAITYDFPLGPAPSYCWEAAADPGDPWMGPVFRWVADDGTAYGYEPYCYESPDAASALRYLQAALWYAARLGLPPAFYAPGATIADTSLGGGVAEHRQVNAMRFLAHAATCQTRWHDRAELDGGIAVPSASIKGQASPAITLTHDLVVRYHESSLNLVMAYAAAHPYDLGAPRPCQRALMTDHPLVEWDLFSPPLTGTVSGGTQAARQWRALPATPFANLGRSFTFPDRDIDPLAFAGDPAHVTLTRPFAPRERCRQIVFWSASWLDYEDAETAPSAPVDASRYPLSGPLLGRSFDQRMASYAFCKPLLLSFRNPEKSLCFTSDVTGLPTGADVSGLIVGDSDGADQGVGNAAVFSGLHGADRDFDGRLGRGPLPASTRLRAHEVARFNYYDPRLTLELR